MRRAEIKFTLISLLILAPSAFIFTQFLSYHEVSTNKSGFVINDPIFHLLPRKDHSLFIFSLTYGSIVLYSGLNFNSKGFAAKAILSYALILLFRIPTLMLVPLKVHPELIYLQDPFLNDLIYPSKITNDLFFSGHAALLFSFILLSKYRWVFAILFCLLALMLVSQRVHYSIDILGAIPFAFLAVKLADFILIKWGMNRID